MTSRVENSPLACVSERVKDLNTDAEGLAGNKHVIVWDCESDSSFSSLPGSTHDDKLKYMQFTVVAAVVIPVGLILGNASPDDIIAHSTSHIWWRDACACPINDLLDMFDSASLIVGYNCLAFDFPLVRRFYRPTSEYPNPQDRYLMHRSKTLDIMTRVRDATGKYFKLDRLLECNGIECKTGDGLQAISLWNMGKREELANYCVNDAKVTAKLALLTRVFVSNTSFVSEPCVGIAASLRAVNANNQRAEEYVWVDA
jgi:hypothetical protein